MVLAASIDAASIDVVPAAPDPAVSELAAALARLEPRAPRREVERLARTAVETTRKLGHRYRAGRVGWWHNVLVHTGARERGLCWHWAWDLLTALDGARPRWFDLHWGVAHRGWIHEHNAAVVTARGAAFSSGVVLDGWRRGGPLVWAPVRQDRYPWRKRPPPAGAPFITAP